MKIAFPTDEHYPFQDEYARNIALQIVHDFNPDVRVTGSDGLDFYAISNFDKDPSRLKDEANLQNEIDLWRCGQREWRSVSPNAKVFYLVGNHEDRLRKYLWRHPEIATLRSMQLPSILDLGSLDIVWEYEKGINANKELSIYSLTIKHGQYTRKFSSYSAKAELESEFYGTNLLTGHTHRGGSYYIRSRKGLVQSHECFCLCSLEPHWIDHPNWQQGIVLAEVTPTSVVVEAIPFGSAGKKLQAIWREKQYHVKE